MKTNKEYVAEALVFPREWFYKNSYEMQCPHCLGHNIHETDDIFWCYDCCASTSFEYTLELLEMIEV